MKGVDTIARVRREFYVRGRSIKEICRELHVSRNTVRKILRSDEPGRATNVRFNLDLGSGAGRQSLTVC